MTSTLDSVLQTALVLPPESRATLAEKLLQSLDAHDQAEIDAARAAETERRFAAIERGEARTVPAAEVFRSRCTSRQDRVPSA
jgi:putative addiction module component (TIGR02574 family)